MEKRVLGLSALLMAASLLFSTNAMAAHRWRRAARLERRSARLSRRGERLERR